MAQVGILIPSSYPLQLKETRSQIGWYVILVAASGRDPFGQFRPRRIRDPRNRR